MQKLFILFVVHGFMVSSEELSDNRFGLKRMVECSASSASAGLLGVRAICLSKEVAALLLNTKAAPTVKKHMVNRVLVGMVLPFIVSDMFATKVMLEQLSDSYNGIITTKAASSVNAHILTGLSAGFLAMHGIMDLRSLQFFAGSASFYATYCMIKKYQRYTHKI